MDRREAQVEEGRVAQRGCGVSPGGDAHGASTRSGVRARRGPPGCASARAGTRSPGPAPHCSCPKSPWRWAPGTSAHTAPASQGAPAATFPRRGTLPGKTRTPHTTQVSLGSSLSSPPSRARHP